MSVKEGRDATMPSMRSMISEQELSAIPRLKSWIGTGVGSGVIPCGDCPGIEVDVILNTDGTYIMRETKLERYEPTRQTEVTTGIQRSES